MDDKALTLLTGFLSNVPAITSAIGKGAELVPPNHALISFKNNFWAILVGFIVSIGFFLIRWHRYGKKKDYFYQYIAIGLIISIYGLFMNALLGVGAKLLFGLDGGLYIITQIPSSLLCCWAFTKGMWCKAFFPYRE